MNEQTHTHADHHYYHNIYEGVLCDGAHTYSNQENFVSVYNVILLYLLLEEKNIFPVFSYGCPMLNQEHFDGL